jgi:hypothetical protein
MDRQKEKRMKMRLKCRLLILLPMKRRSDDASVDPLLESQREEAQQEPKVEDVEDDGDKVLRIS